MSGPYFQKRSWPAFMHQGVTYSLIHLDEHQLEVIDSQAIKRLVAVTYSDHCFTREPAATDDPALHYPDSTRRLGYFCVDRYQYSLGLAGQIVQATTRQVWTIRDDSFAILPVIDHRGVKTFYGILFSLDRVKGLPVDLHMRIKTAYPCDENEIVTFGSVRFSHLVTLRMQGKSPKRITDRHRKRPRVT
jgi:hypothetical protein